MKRKIGATLVALALLGLLTACGAPDHGYAKNKDYNPPSDIYTAGYCGSTDSKTGSCTYYVPGHYTHYPASWELDIYTDLNNDKKPHGWVDVDPYTYDHIKIGDSWQSNDYKSKHTGGNDENSGNH